MMFILLQILFILSQLEIIKTFDESIHYQEGNHPFTTTQPSIKSSTSSSINATVLSYLYNKVMKTYDKKFRPDFEANATSIGLEMHVLSFANLDEGGMEYGIDFYFAQVWYDKRFKVYKPKHSKAVINIVGEDVEDVWVPDTVFVNSKSSQFHMVTIDNRFLSVNLSDGRIIYHSRITTIASCRLDLHDYPFDIQTCYLAIESYGYDSSDIIYNWYDMFTGESDCKHEYCMHIHVYDKEMSNFDLIKARKSKNKTSYHAPTFSSASAIFTFRRRSNYFIFQVYIPSSLIVMVAWTSFWMTPTAVPARSAICVTTVLTLITMLGIVNANMPKVSYIKALDLYLLVSFLFVFSALFEFIIVLNVTTECMQRYFGWFYRCQSKDEQKMMYEGVLAEETNGIHEMNKYNDKVAEGNQTLYPLRACYGECFPNGITARRKKKIHETVIIPLREEITSIDSLEKKECTPPSAVIDICARILFPILYASFNIGYWVKYAGDRRHHRLLH